MRRLRAGPGKLAGDAGVSFVEAAVVLPVVIVIMIAAFDFGRAFTTLSVAQKGLRTATRFLTTLPLPAVCGWGLPQAQNLAVFGNVAGTGKAAVTGWRPADVILELPANCTDPNNVSVVRLTTWVTYNALIWQAIGLPSQVRLSTEHEERWLGG